MKLLLTSRKFLNLKSFAFILLLPLCVEFACLVRERDKEIYRNEG